jgi:hypothetical protein
MATVIVCLDYRIRMFDSEHTGELTDDILDLWGLLARRRRKRLSEKFYFGRHWGSFDCPLEALVDAKFPKAFAEQVVRDAAGKDVFVAGTENDYTGVRLVRLGDKWDRWFVQFATLYALPKQPGRKARRRASQLRSLLSPQASFGPKRRAGLDRQTAQGCPQRRKPSRLVIRTAITKR